MHLLLALISYVHAACPITPNDSTALASSKAAAIEYCKNSPSQCVNQIDAVSAVFETVTRNRDKCVDSVVSKYDQKIRSDSTATSKVLQNKDAIVSANLKALFEEAVNYANLKSAQERSLDSLRKVTQQLRSKDSTYRIDTIAEIKKKWLIDSMNLTNTIKLDSQKISSYRRLDSISNSRRIRLGVAIGPVYFLEPFRYYIGKSDSTLEEKTKASKLTSIVSVVTNINILPCELNGHGLCSFKSGHGINVSAGTSLGFSNASGPEETGSFLMDISYGFGYSKELIPGVAISFSYFGVANPEIIGFESKRFKVSANEKYSPKDAEISTDLNSGISIQLNKYW